MKIWDFFYGNRYGLAIWCIIIGLLIPAVLGAILGLIMGGYFWASIQSMFWCFGAPSVVSGLLLILTPISEDLSIGFGYGLYYGSIFTIYIFTKIESETLPYVAGILLTAVVCYAVYLKLFKDK